MRFKDGTKYTDARKKYIEKNLTRIREQARSAGFRTKYGLTVEQYDEMLLAQGGVCANPGCKKKPGKRRLAVDHCHRTGKIRALLCSGCNVALGQLEESPERLTGLVSYLEKYRGED